ncbi:hypothetical protein HPB51_010784 [Rhipicephalus microplus]|uniref:Uncharacterized protein n=1 Tax=Rhipicephalus microplus TaxID=6941 RepID=A0A9J6DUI1_RHIMP|nr:hypothetical protein HPB51_010784 [Rhipicephalus microplus]
MMRERDRLASPPFSISAGSQGGGCEGLAYVSVGAWKASIEWDVREEQVHRKGCIGCAAHTFWRSARVYYLRNAESLCLERPMAPVAFLAASSSATRSRRSREEPTCEKRWNFLLPIVLPLVDVRATVGLAVWAGNTTTALFWRTDRGAFIAIPVPHSLREDVEDSRRGWGCDCFAGLMCLDE